MTIPKEEQKELLLKLKEKYNFKKEKDSSWSFEYNKKKAFIINLSEQKNIKIITPFILRRQQLGTSSEKLFENLDNEIFNRTELIGFMKFAIEVIGNMLDKYKMGSVEGYINMIYQDIKAIEDYFEFLSIMTDIIAMVDHSANFHINKFSKEKMNAIHNAYFQYVVHGDNREYMIENNGSIKLLVKMKGKVDPQDEYNLSEMIPINREEI